MKRDNDVLFSERFQMVFEHLGVLSFMYVKRECRGIKYEDFINETRNYKTDTNNILCLLKKYELINERDGFLHLNRRKFFSLTMWDLLLLVEPWLNTTAPPGEEANYSALKQFARSEKLCSALITI